MVLEFISPGQCGGACADSDKRYSQTLTGVGEQMPTVAKTPCAFWSGHLGASESTRGQHLVSLATLAATPRD